jgi:imidazolonepropionase-like amidohydrolase
MRLNKNDVKRMQKIIRLSWSLFIIYCVSAASLKAQSGQIILTNANLIDGITAEVKRGQTIVIENGKIEAIKTDMANIPEDATVIDASGYYVLPGLIDAHAHVSTLENARRALTYGTTTIRSASVGSYADVSLQRLVQEGKIAGPEIIPAGVFVQPDLGESILADPALADLHDGVESEEALRRLVRINIENGVQVIKTRSAERAGSPETDPRKQVYTERQLSIIVDEAAKSDLPVMAHAHGAVLEAAKAGVVSIEHGTYASEDALQMMKEKGTYLVPTYSTVIDLTEPGGDYDHPVTTIRGQYMLPQMEKMLKMAMDMGVNIAASTDSGYGPESINRVATEAVNFVELGMEPAAAIRSATSGAAELLRISDRTGSIEAGKEADLILVYGNPLEDIRALQDVIMVISNGEVANSRLPFGVSEN